jgi:hypothetical protein
VLVNRLKRFWFDEQAELPVGFSISIDRVEKSRMN